MTHPNRIKLFYAVMEIEAWFLAMYRLFERIAPLLTVGYIKEKLTFDLGTIDPQETFFRPSRQVQDIFGLCGRRYDKKMGDSEAICSRMELEDFDDARENKRCKCFDDFYQEVASKVDGNRPGE